MMIISVLGCCEVIRDCLVRESRKLLGAQYADAENVPVQAQQYCSRIHGTSNLPLVLEANFTSTVDSSAVGATTMCRGGKGRGKELPSTALVVCPLVFGVVAVGRFCVGGAAGGWTSGTTSRPQQPRAYCNGAKHTHEKRHSTHCADSGFLTCS